MGVSCMSASSSCYDTGSTKTTIINPYEFKVVALDTVYRPFCILLLKYNCESFGGYKLAVYNCLEIEKEVINQPILDPHFSQKKPEISPFARFRPDKEGLHMAKFLCKHQYSFAWGTVYFPKENEYPVNTIKESDLPSF